MSHEVILDISATPGGKELLDRLDRLTSGELPVKLKLIGSGGVDTSGSSGGKSGGTQDPGSDKFAENLKKLGAQFDATGQAKDKFIANLKKLESTFSGLKIDTNPIEKALHAALEIAIGAALSKAIPALLKKIPVLIGGAVNGAEEGGIAGTIAEGGIPGPGTIIGAGIGAIGGAIATSVATDVAENAAKAAIKQITKKDEAAFNKVKGQPLNAQDFGIPPGIEALGNQAANFASKQVGNLGNSAVHFLQGKVQEVAGGSNVAVRFVQQKIEDVGNEAVHFTQTAAHNLVEGAYYNTINAAKNAIDNVTKPKKPKKKLEGRVEKIQRLPLLDLPGGALQPLDVNVAKSAEPDYWNPDSDDYDTDMGIAVRTGNSNGGLDPIFYGKHGDDYYSGKRRIPRKGIHKPRKPKEQKPKEEEKKLNNLDPDWDKYFDPNSDEYDTDMAITARTGNPNGGLDPIFYGDKGDDYYSGKLKSGENWHEVVDQYSEGAFSIDGQMISGTPRRTYDQSSKTKKQSSSKQAKDPVNDNFSIDGQPVGGEPKFPLLQLQEAFAIGGQTAPSFGQKQQQQMLGADILAGFSGGNTKYNQGETTKINSAGGQQTSEILEALIKTPDFKPDGGRGNAQTDLTPHLEGLKQIMQSVADKIGSSNGPDTAAQLVSSVNQVVQILGSGL